MAVPTRLFLFALQILMAGYRYLISPVMAGNCRHLPTCSQYADEAMILYGPYKGLWLTIKRISRCHPWGTSGYDPVPPIPDPKHSAKLSQKSVAELLTDRNTSR